MTSLHPHAYIKTSGDIEQMPSGKECQQMSQESESYDEPHFLL